MIKEHLSSTGVAIISNKVYYFGVGGGTSEMKALIDKSAGALVLESSALIADGASNMREILVIRRLR